MDNKDPLYYYPSLSNNFENIPKYYPLYLHHDDWSSIYIPYLDNSYSYEYLKEIIEMRYNIGKVSQIDFVKSPQKKGNSKEYNSAFVHFEYWYNSDFAIFLRYYLNKHEKYNISNYFRYFRPLPPNSSIAITDNFHILINKSNYKMREAPLSDSYFKPIKQPNKHVWEDNITNVLEQFRKRFELLENEITAIKNILTKQKE
jgi:hypothetical protein